MKVLNLLTWDSIGKYFALVSKFNNFTNAKAKVLNLLTRAKYFPILSLGSKFNTFGKHHSEKMIVITL